MTNLVMLTVEVRQYLDRRTVALHPVITLTFSSPAHRDKLTFSGLLQTLLACGIADGTESLVTTAPFDEEWEKKDYFVGIHFPVSARVIDLHKLIKRSVYPVGEEKGDQKLIFYLTIKKKSSFNAHRSIRSVVACDLEKLAWPLWEEGDVDPFNLQPLGGWDVEQLGLATPSRECANTLDNLLVLTLATYDPVVDVWKTHRKVTNLAQYKVMVHARAEFEPVFSRELPRELYLALVFEVKNIRRGMTEVIISVDEPIGIEVSQKYCKAFDFE